MRSNQSGLLGSTVKYAVSDEAKRYTMLDNFFEQTPRGNFQYERVLSPRGHNQSAPKLKISVSKDFSELTINAVTQSGLRKIDLYKKDDRQEAREFAEYVLDDLVEQGVLVKAEA